MWRAAVSVVLAVACLLAAGCGDDETTGSAARHLDPRSDAVVAVDLDYDGPNWQQIKRLYARAVQRGAVDAGVPTPPTLDGALGQLAGFLGLSFADDIRPLLGGTLQLGVRTEPAAALSAEARDLLERLDLDASGFGEGEFVGRDGKPLAGVTRAEVNAALDEQGERRPRTTFTAVYRVEDAEALARVLEKLRGQGLEPEPMAGVEDAQLLGDGVAIAGGDTLVAVLDGDGESSDQLLRERVAAGGDGPAALELEDDLIAARAAPTMLGAWLDRDELARALVTAPGRALRDAEARVRLEEDAARGSARVDFEGLPDDELPLPGPGALALPPGEGVASASANQSLTTVFLARLARELYPESRFVRRVERLEERTGLRFEDEVLRQFSGPSFSILRSTDTGALAFGARSTLRDPAAMRALLGTIAPDLPGILEGLEGLGSVGLTSLLFVAPDAPLTPSAFALLAQVDVTRLPGGGPDELYEVSGLNQGGAAPDRIVYGIVGDAFVVASSPELAREVAAIRAEPAPEAATRVRADAAALAEQGAGFLGGEDDAGTIRALVEGAEASASAQDGDIVGAAELRWTR